METTEITYGSKKVGNAMWDREGLYYLIRCRCDMPQAGLYRIKAESDAGIVDLGTCIPSDHMLCLDTKVAIKKLGTGPVRFSLLSGHISPAERFVPLETQGRFCDFSLLEAAMFDTVDGQPGLRIFIR